MTFRHSTLPSYFSVAITALVIASPGLLTFPGWFRAVQGELTGTSQSPSAVTPMDQEADSRTIPLDRVSTLPAFIDATVPKLMKDHHVVGTAVAVVHDGRIIVLQGYGHARLDSVTILDPSRTVFRIG